MLDTTFRSAALEASSYHISESSFDVLCTKVVHVAPQSPRVQKEVRFSSDVESHKIAHRLDMEEQEKKHIWYRTKDYKRIRKEGQETAKMIRDGDLIKDTDHHCLLGLDNETHIYARQRSLHKLMIQAVVSDEQERQREEDIKDTELFAWKIRDFDSRCRHAAFVAGLRTDRTERRGYIN